MDFVVACVVTHKAILSSGRKVSRRCFKTFWGDTQGGAPQNRLASRPRKFVAIFSGFSFLLETHVLV
jgi:hypothetical protein